MSSLHRLATNLLLRVKIKFGSFPEQKLAREFDIDTSRIKRYRREYQELDLHNDISAKLDQKPANTGWERTDRVGEKFELLYTIARILQPDRIIETGVCDGQSTAILLQALDQNGSGQLRSIDLPVYQDDQDPYEDFGSYLPPGESSGWIIPDRLRHRWRLYEGRSDEHLESIFEDWETVDMFFHDSAHTYDTMSWEYTTAWPHINPDGLLMSDDTYLPRFRGEGDPFTDFTDSIGQNSIVYLGMGLIRKSEDAE